MTSAVKIADTASGSSDKYHSWDSRRLWSLWDMINFTFAGIYTALQSIRQHLAVCFARVHEQRGSELLDGPYRQVVENNLQWVHTQAAKYFLTATEDRVVRIWNIWSGDVSFGMLGMELKPLLEALEDDLEKQRFHHYSIQKSRMLILIPADWAAAIRVFPQIQGEIESAIDCYALGHQLACVFHMMRIMEAGVQRFGRKLGVSVTKKTATKLTDLTWHNILDALNPKISALPQKTARSKEKHERCSAIQSYLYGVKDAWRNPTMHPRRAGYSEGETLNIINHVKSFMSELALLISPPSKVS